ncbi:transmembrane emp24 domain-containing p24delta3-like [Olea europaea subsp. europaea]|uniref:Transmembrane emp24 domain-containing p24delta3-like n=1 Tax=Olea europaea subsp. europaea TaxID=158383 RepID=A0A8S0RVW3_OLEEU|nr:transmembrane emp24 domain-containing p24delta3-like [Olea europaea subsp. europaea]
MVAMGCGNGSDLDYNSGGFGIDNDGAVILNITSGGHDSYDGGNIQQNVTSPYGNNLHHQENVTHGQFAFTTTESGNYLACFWKDNSRNGGGNMNVGLEWKTGIATKDWDSVAKKEKIEGLELELQKLEGAVEAIHENLIYLKDREAEMREVSERTNARVGWFSIMSLGVCIVVSISQLFYLKRYFQKKKLI